MRLVHLKDAKVENRLVKMLARRFKDENEDLYSPYWYTKAKRLYIYFMLGTYNPKRPKSWEYYYDREKEKKN